MKPISGFKPTQQQTGETQKLPVGGYVMKILGATVETFTGSNGEYSKLKLAIDVNEGENKGFFSLDFKNNTREDKKFRGIYRINIPDESSPYYDKQKASFENLVWAVEQSNPGYTWAWDEKTLKGKQIGVIYGEKEWEFNGKNGFTTVARFVTSVEEIHQGKFKLPKPWLLPEGKRPKSALTTLEDAPADEPEEKLPWE